MHPPTCSVRGWDQFRWKDRQIQRGDGLFTWPRAANGEALFTDYSHVIICLLVVVVVACLLLEGYPTFISASPPGVQSDRGKWTIPPYFEVAEFKKTGPEA